MYFTAEYKTLNIITNNPIERKERYEGENEKEVVKKIKLINYVVNNEIKLTPTK